MSTGVLQDSSLKDDEKEKKTTRQKDSLKDTKTNRLNRALLGGMRL
jgi:hypothetical protein